MLQSCRHRAFFSQTKYPSRPIYLIVGFTPGAALDVLARTLSKGAEPMLDQQIVVEDKPGAGSSIAARYVAHAANDGYTLLLLALSTLTYPIAHPSLSLNMSKDFAPVARIASGAIVFMVDPNSKVHSVSELVALAKSKPGKVLFGSVGAGTLLHLCAVLFTERAGLKLVHVPYRGSPEAVTDLMAGRITMMFAPADQNAADTHHGQSGCSRAGYIAADFGRQLAKIHLQSRGGPYIRYTQE